MNVPRLSSGGAVAPPTQLASGLEAPEHFLPLSSSANFCFVLFFPFRFCFFGRASFENRTWTVRPALRLQKLGNLRSDGSKTMFELQ